MKGILLLALLLAAAPAHALTLLTSAARTTTTATADQLNTRFSSVDISINVTAIVDTPSIVCTVQGKDTTAGVYYTVLASAAITATGQTVLRVGRGLLAAANTVANFPLPRTWRINCVAADADSATYSIDVNPAL